LIPRENLFMLSIPNNRPSLFPAVNAPIRAIGVDACPLVQHRTGVANYVLTLLEPLCQRYPQVRFFLYSNDEIAFPNLPNVVCRTSRPKRRGPFWQNTQLVQMVAQDRPDVFWGTNGMLPLWGMRDIPRVLTVCDLADKFAPSTQQRLVRWNRRIFQALSVHRATCTIAISAATGEDMQRCYGRGADAVIHPLAAAHFQRPDVREVIRVREELDLPDQFWLTVGTPCQQRGVPVPTLLLAGGGGWLNEEIEAQIRLGETKGTLRRLGFVNNRDLVALYAACEVFLMPSLYEGFGMPILEAQMCGAVVVHGHHASMVEAGGGLGVSVDPNQDSLEATLTKLVQGEVTLVCRLPTDPLIQHQAQGLLTLEQALGLKARQS
jgi:glycosyltransferase involved in cell wall biosynthesis